MQSCRYEAALEFFTNPSLLEKDSLCAICTAIAARALRDIPRASNIIYGLLVSDPTSGIVWMERANILRAQGDISGPFS